MTRQSEDEEDERDSHLKMQLIITSKSVISAFSEENGPNKLSREGMNLFF